jgi:hypothetical protein
MCLWGPSQIIADTNGKKLDFLEKNLSKYLFAHHRFYVD